MEIETGLQTATERLITKRHHEAEKLFRTAYLVVKENLSFTKYASICKLQQLNGLELGENYLTDMACSRFVKSIAGDLRNEIAHSINDCRFVSILSDGATDKGIVEEEMVYARYIRDGKPKTSLIKVQQPNTVDVGGITDAIKEAINSLKPHDGSDGLFDNFFKKVINANFDGASVLSNTMIFILGSI